MTQNEQRELWSIRHDIERSKAEIAFHTKRIEALRVEEQEALYRTIDWLPQPTDKQRIDAAKRAAKKVGPAPTGRNHGSATSWDGDVNLHSPAYFDWESKDSAQVFVDSLVAAGMPVVWDAEYQAIAVLPRLVRFSSQYGGRSDEAYGHRHYVQSQYAEIIAR